MAVTIPLNITASPINLAMHASRQSGVSPLAILFHSVGTTSADVTSRPFDEIEYRWNFGDTSAGTWANGSGSNTKKNIAYGPIAAHVFETTEGAGTQTFTVTLTAYDGTNTASQTMVITVTDPATVYAGTDTVVVSTDGDFTGSPSGASEVTSADFDSALGNAGTGKRVLFKRGQSFTASATTNIGTASGWTIGAFGTGDLPVVNLNATVTPFTFNGAASDGRIMDLNIVGSGALEATSYVASYTSSPTNILIMRLTTSDTGRGFTVSSGQVLKGGFFVQNTITDYHDTSGGNAFFGYLRGGAWIGNLVGPFDGEHGIRLQQAQFVAVTNNTVTSPSGSNRACLLVRANTYAGNPENNTQYVYVADNKLVDGDNIWTMTVRPTSSSLDQRISDVIVERNWFVAGTAHTISLTTVASRVTVRVNVFDLTSSATPVAVNLSNDNETSTLPTPDGSRVYNNTFFSSTTDTGFVAVNIQGNFGDPDRPVTNTYVKNNLAYAPNDSTHLLLQLAGDTTGTVGASGTFGNSTDAQVGATDPFNGVTPTTPATFLPAGSSYAIGNNAAVPVWSDFFLEAPIGASGAVNQ